MDAIILAGGKGTRLRSAVSDRPKPMADINGKPFLSYLLDHLSDPIISRFILSVGYMSDIVRDYFEDSYNGVPIVYSEELEPLGTGGAIKKSLTFCDKGESYVLVTNGDTYLNYNIGDLLKAKDRFNSNIMVCSEVDDAERFGSVEIKQHKIVGFKQNFPGKGFINAGTYLLKKSIVEDFKLSKFSFEEDFLKPQINFLDFFSVITKESFVDIGIPEDYRRLQKLLN